MSNARRVGVLFAHRQDLRQNGDELLHQLRIETRARFALDQRDRVLDGPGLLVGAHRRQRVEHVGDRRDAAHQRDLFALEAPVIAGAVPLLVMGQGDEPRHRQEAVAVLADDLAAERHVLAHDLDFVVVQLPGLEQHVVADADLADVVHGRGVEQEVHVLLVHAHRLAEQAAVVGDADDVHARLVVAELAGAAQALDDLQPGVAQLRRALAHHPLQLAILVVQRQVRFHAGLHDRRADRLGDVIDRPQGETLAPRPRPGSWRSRR